MKRAGLMMMAALLTVLPVTGAEVPAEGELSSALTQQVIPEEATAQEILALCRAMVPADVVISGRVNRRSRHGKTISLLSYVLKRRAGVTELVMKDEAGRPIEVTRTGRIAETDVTWSDLTMDFLWWTDVAFDTQAEAEAMSGILCKVLLLKNGTRAYRAWIDRRTGALLQACELRQVEGEWKTGREVFCTSLKKFGDRWAPRHIEVGPPGAKYRTKIIVENVEDVK